MRFLVTGGAGFIGSHLTEELLKEGHYVRVLDNFSTGKWENLASCQQRFNRLEVEEADLRDLSVTQRVCQGIDGIFHLGALPSVSRSLENPRETTEINILGTINLLVSACKAGVKKVIFASSSSVYGNTPQLPKKEGIFPEPLSPYAVTKLAGEEYCKIFTSTFGLDTIILRYFNVFGPRQDPASFYAAVIPKFIRLALQGKPLPVYGNGNQSRDFSYVGNVVSANLKAWEVQDAAGQIFNIGCGERFTLNQLIKELKDALGTDLEVQYLAPRPGDVLHSYADVSKAKTILGYEPMIRFPEGLRYTIHYFRKAG
jgi:nucleoside-diphosphate-sugar epimerase